MVYQKKRSRTPRKVGDAGISIGRDAPKLHPSNRAATLKSVVYIGRHRTPGRFRTGEINRNDLVAGFQVLWQNIFITFAPRQESSENFRASLDAEVALAKQDIATDFLELWQTETCPALRQHFAQQYRRMVGVDPSRHDEFRQALERIRDGGGMPVAHLMTAFNRTDHENGFSGAAGSAVGT